MKPTTIAIVNQKGGVGKTATTANLGIGLAREGKRVLLIDSDPQGSLSISLGHPQPDTLPVTLSTIMKKMILDEPTTPKEGILRHEESIDLLPANIELSGMEVSLVNAMSRERVLKQYIDSVKRDYDYVLLDCMKLEALKHQGERSDLASSQVGTKLQRADGTQRLGRRLMYARHLLACRLQGSDQSCWTHATRLLSVHIGLEWRRRIGISRLPSHR